MRLAALCVAMTVGVVIGAAAQEAGKAPAAVAFTIGKNVTAPVVIKEARPVYPAEAKAAGLQGTVLLECVVSPKGTVGNVKVVRSLETSLDAAAIAALEKWTFKPGKKGGQAVPVKVQIEMTFTLR